MRLRVLVPWVALVVGACGETPDPPAAGGEPAAAVSPALAGTRWEVTFLQGGVDPAQAPRRPTLEFLDAGQAAGHSGCNPMAGSWNSDGGGLTFGGMALTRMACPEPVTAVETAFLDALDRTRASALVGDELVLQGAGGVLLARLRPAS
ncbi:MAG: META domain-containing protein [Gemmatimonadota bacterium]